MSKRLSIALCAAVALSTVLLACGHPSGGAVYVRTAPPPPVTETIVASPGPDFVWIRGYHRWDGDHYVWVGGRWERHPPGRHAWVEGHWRHNHNGWYWQEGHWR